jgi:hypothetical protein
LRGLQSLRGKPGLVYCTGVRDRSNYLCQQFLSPLYLSVGLNHLLFAPLLYRFCHFLGLGLFVCVSTSARVKSTNPIRVNRRHECGTKPLCWPVRKDSQRRCISSVHYYWVKRACRVKVCLCCLMNPRISTRNLGRPYTTTEKYIVLHQPCGWG